MPTKSPKPAKNTKPKTRAKKKGEVKQPRETSLMALEDGDALLNVGAARAARFGRCGGRPLVTELEREVCDRLTNGGVAHSHRPRHFEVKLTDESLAAFAPTIVVRGRGREGKVLVIETLEAANDDTVRKIAAFRVLHGVEFFVSVVAPESVLDAIPFDLADEMLATTELYALIGRLTD